MKMFSKKDVGITNKSKTSPCPLLVKEGIKKLPFRIIF